MKARVCKAESCGKKFVPERSFQKGCSYKCAIEIYRQGEFKRERRERRKARQRLKTRAQWMKEAQTAFNSYIRARDALEPCISCQRHHAGQDHAGHYRSVGACPELRFNEDNCHKQCAPCNNHKSGNVIDYRINLVNKIGLERVEWLEGPHTVKKYSIEEIKEIKAKYKQKCKEMERKKL